MDNSVKRILLGTIPSNSKTVEKEHHGRITWCSIFIVFSIASPSWPRSGQSFQAVMAARSSKIPGDTNTEAQTAQLEGAVRKLLGPLYKIEYHSRATIAHRKTVAGPVDRAS